MVTAGKLRAIGVTCASRLRSVPDVPTLHEIMKNDLPIQDNWNGLAAPLSRTG